MAHSENVRVVGFVRGTIRRALALWGDQPINCRAPEFKVSNHGRRVRKNPCISFELNFVAASYGLGICKRGCHALILFLIVSCGKFLFSEVYKGSRLSPLDSAFQNFKFTFTQSSSRQETKNHNLKMQPFIASAVEDKKTPVEQGQDLCRPQVHQSSLTFRHRYVNPLFEDFTFSTMEWRR